MTRPWLLIETATSQALVGLADADGALVGSEAWHSSHRHGEELLARLDALLVAAAIGRRDLGGVAVGTGPGSFTGLRIGLATAKTIAFSLGVPIVGLPTMASLALSAGDGEWSVALPAGVGDRYLARYAVHAGAARELLAPTLTPVVPRGDALLAVDLLAEDVPAAALELGRRAQAGLAGVLATAAARELGQGRSVDVARLVPEYVALPRGVPAASAEMAWSPDLR